MPENKITESKAKKVVEYKLNCGVHGSDPELNEAQGFLAGIEAERERVKPLIEALKKAELGLHEAVLERDAPCFRWPYEAVKEALAAYQSKEEE